MPSPAALFKQKSGSLLLMNLLMFLATFCWGANIIAGKFALRGINAMTLAHLRIIGATILFSVAFLARRPLAALRMPRKEWLFLALVAFNGITLNQVFFIGGLSRTSAAHTALIVGLGPVMVLILSLFMRLESLTALKSAGIALAFAGMAVLGLDKAAPGSEATWRGDLIQFCGTTVFAYYTILLKKVANRHDAVTLNLATFLLGGVFMIPFSFRSVQAMEWSSVPGPAWLGAGFMILFGTSLAYLAYAHALTGLSATQVATYAYLQPVVAIALGVLILGEHLSWRVIEGGVMILLGVCVSEWGGERPTRREARA